LQRIKSQCVWRDGFLKDPTITMPPSPLPLSVFIIALNEADRLPATLRAARELSNDLIVVDSGSADGTQAIAQSLGARVVHRDWTGYGPQKRFAESLCAHDWRLNLDADEVLSDELIAEIRALFESAPDPASAYAFAIADVFPGDSVSRPGAYALTPVRLYHRAAGSYSASPTFDRVDLKPHVRTVRLKARVHHHSVRSLSHLLRKLDAYSDQQIAEMAARGRSLPAWRLLTEFPAAFLKSWIWRGYIVRGSMGFSYAMIWAFARWMRVAKSLEARRKGVQPGRSASPPSGAASPPTTSPPTE
jgi:glycosyltransferase involved in cell wall biosynthesis